MHSYPVFFMTKTAAAVINGGLSETSKMPCKSYSLPTVACQTGFKMAQIEGSVCASCYANKGNYARYANNIEPAQHARLDSIDSQYWVAAMVGSIGADPYFRWHDSGDLQSLEHFQKIVAVCLATPATLHWLPTREYKIISDYIKAGYSIPVNLFVRLSAMYPDRPVTVPAALQNIAGITTSNVHTSGDPIQACNAPNQDGECRDCRKCWSMENVTYKMH